MKYTAIILSGGESERFKHDKGLFHVLGRPLISYILGVVVPLVDEAVIVTRSLNKIRDYSRCFPYASVVVDEYNIRAALSGALTGFKNADGEYSLLLPCDTPLISQKSVSLLLELVPGYDAVIPRWPNGYIEPLQAVYRTNEAYKATQQSINLGKYGFKNMISRLKKVLYVSTLVIKKFDRNLLTFKNVNTLRDLEEVERLLKRRGIN